PFDGDAKLLPHGAATAVGADQILAANAERGAVRRAHLRRHAVLVLRESDEAVVEAHVGPACRRMLAQHWLQHVLGADERPGRAVLGDAEVLRPEAVELCRREGVAEIDEETLLARESHRRDRRLDAPLAEDLHAAGADRPAPWAP